MINICNFSTLLAYFSLIYILSSILYLIISPIIGTPFKDELKKNPNNKYDDLIKAKKKSSNQRGKIFLGNLIFVSTALVMWRPFKNCVFS